MAASLGSFGAFTPVDPVQAGNTPIGGVTASDLIQPTLPLPTPAGSGRTPEILTAVGQDDRLVSTTQAAGGDYSNITAQQAQAVTTTQPSNATSVAAAPPDFRVRISAQTSNFYSGTILAPLATTSGLMFPYTPTVSVTQDVDYATMSMVHSNTDYNSYSHTPNVNISLSGKFTVQNQTEGKYALACLHFLRTASKMHFGQNDSSAGLPPPILLLSGYGTYMFNRVRVILKGHSYSFDENMNMVPVQVGSGVTHLPAMFTIAVTLTVQQTPNMMRTQFSLDKFKDGSLLANGGWL